MSAVEGSVQPLIHGQRLTRVEFLRRWEALPRLKLAELIEGRVYLNPLVTYKEGQSRSAVAGWLGTYAAYTLVCQAVCNATWLMLEDSPQPDASLSVLTECGGHFHLEGGLAAGAPELAAETSLSSEGLDLHEKLDLYQAAGVDEYFVSLVEPREIRWHRLVNGVYQELPASPDGVMRSQIFPGLWLDPKAFLAGNAVRVLATLHQGLQSPEHAEFVKKLEQRRAQA